MQSQNNNIVIDVKDAKPLLDLDYFDPHPVITTPSTQQTFVKNTSIDNVTHNKPVRKLSAKLLIFRMFISMLTIIVIAGVYIYFSLHPTGAENNFNIYTQYLILEFLVGDIFYVLICIYSLHSDVNLFPMELFVIGFFVHDLMSIFVINFFK